MRYALSIAAGLAMGANGALAGDLALPSAAVAPSNPFAGAYVALGGAYGIGGQRSASIGSSGPPQSFGFEATSFSTSGTSASGWSGIAAGGYNMTFGSWALIGIEVDGRWGDEKISRAGATTNVSQFPNLPGGQINYSYTSSSDAGVHLAARLGATTGNTLIFGKLGVGALRFKDSFGVDQTGAQRCTAFGSSGPPLFQTICTASVTGGAGTHTSERWLPSLIFGVGVEQNFGAFFARGQVEAEVIAQNTYNFTQPTANGWTFSGSSSTSNTQWTTRASLMAGVRF